MATRTRLDAGLIPEWDNDPKSTNVLLWYARAIAEMKKRPINDPTSWRYQAAIHEYRRTRDPLKNPSDRLPGKSEQDKFWSRCQHTSWFFLPWHRWYLWYFEQIVAATVVKLKGPADWSLPYWNYSRGNDLDARRLPKAFTERSLPDGSPNPLRVDDRENGNDNAPVGDDTDVDIVRCLQETTFPSSPADIGFGGPKTGFMHGGGSDVGALEIGPHGFMHVAVNGWMGQFYTAALDPIFWCHHANIDRLWVVWRKRDASNVDPTDSAWLNMTFDFHDAKKAVVTRRVRDAVDTIALGYQYEDTSDPLAAAAGFAEEAIAPERRSAMAEQPIAEMIGASEGSVPLTAGATETVVALAPPSGPAAAAGAGESAEAPAADIASRRIFVRLENITGEGHPRRYSVYVNGAFAGAVPLFGVEEASTPTEAHAGGGLHYRLDVTNVVRALASQGNWDPATVKVTFVADTKTSAAAGMEETVERPQPNFEVGRVSVYVV